MPATIKPIANICLAVLIASCGFSASAQESFDGMGPAQAIQPPPVPDRTALPALKQEESLPPRGTGIPKPPLAWRAGIIRKNKVASGVFAMPTLAPPISQHLFAGPPATAKRVYLSSQDDAFFALLSACPRKGLMVLFMDSIGGRLVAGINSSTISFSVKSLPGNRATIEANVERGDPQALNRVLDDLLLSIGSSLANGGTF